MPSLLRAPFPEIITALPVDDHSIEVKAADPTNDWNAKFAAAGLTPLWQTIFGANASIRISRNRILNHPYATQEQKCAEILLWGYPNDMRGIVSRLLPSLTTLSELASTPEPWPNYANDIRREIKAVGGKIGISTITKLAYFHRRTFNNLDALILDLRLIDTTARWTELAALDLSYDKARRLYPRYLEVMNAAAQQVAAAAGRPCTAVQLELFLFSLGDSF